MIFTEPTQMSLHPGEHIGEDGLIHCDICKTPRQVSLYLFGQLRTFRCQCLCQQARRQEERDQLQRQESYDRFARLQSVGMRDPSLRECTFAASRYNVPVMGYAKNYVDRFQSTSMGLLLWGPVGTGKTYLAACIANALMAQGISVLMTNFGRILGALPGTEEKARIYDRVLECCFPILVQEAHVREEIRQSKYDRIRKKIK